MTPPLRPLMAGLLMLGLSATTIRSEEIMSPEEFKAFSSGTTVFFNRYGSAYGAETYGRNNEVIWTFLDGKCQHGRWFGKDKAICFQYDGQPDPQCWYFLKDGAQKHARLIGDAPEHDLIVVGQNNKKLDCRKPYIGASAPRPETGQETAPHAISFFD